MNISHRPVLLAEAVTALVGGPLIQNQNSAKQILVIDGTFGRGGHTQALLKELNSSARMISFDKDLDAIAVAQQINDPRLKIVHDSFAQMDQYAEAESVDGILLDLGISSPQVDEAHRGFSFRREGPLDMRMNTDHGLTAAEWLEQAPPEEITQVIKTYGEERFAYQIAKAIVAKREEGLSPKTTTELASLVASVVRTREAGQDPATRTFQALRIYVNRELEELKEVLPKILERLKTGGMMVVISFHSLEDRIVKQFINDEKNRDTLPSNFPIRSEDLPKPRLNIVTKPIRPSVEEVKYNPRSRSGIMRVAERTAY